MDRHPVSRSWARARREASPFRRRAEPFARLPRYPSMPTVLITGANRGLGLEFARQYSTEGWRVIATARDPTQADELQQLKVRIEPLDLRDLDAVTTVG